MLSDWVAACGELAESFTWGVKKKLPDAVGVPLITPELESVKPAGNCPETTLQE